MHPLVVDEIDDRTGAADDQHRIVFLDPPLGIDEQPVVGFQAADERAAPRSRAAAGNQAARLIGLSRRLPCCVDGSSISRDARRHVCRGDRPLQRRIEEVGVHADRDGVRPAAGRRAEVHLVADPVELAQAARPAPRPNSPIPTARSGCAACRASPERPAAGSRLQRRRRVEDQVADRIDQRLGRRASRVLVTRSRSTTTCCSPRRSRRDTGCRWRRR